MLSSVVDACSGSWHQRLLAPWSRFQLCWMPIKGASHSWKASEGGSNWWRNSWGCTRVLLSGRHACGGCKLAAVTHCKSALMQVPPTTPSPHQSQSATFDQRSSVFNLCIATCNRNMGNDWLHFVACSPMTVQWCAGSVISRRIMK